MDLPVDPVRMSVEEILLDLQAGHREAAALGPAAALAFLQRTVQETIDLPHGVLMQIYDLISEAQAELQDWDGCEQSLAKAHEERKQTQIETPYPLPFHEKDLLTETPTPVPLAVQELAGVLAPPLSKSLDLSVVQDEFRENPPVPIRVPVALIKACCSCGKDVTHKARRKDSVTGTYLCRDCFEKPQAARSRRRINPGQAAIWIAVLSLLAAGAFILLGV